MHVLDHDAAEQTHSRRRDQFTAPAAEDVTNGRA
jgi:hypothetical protein